MALQLIWIYISLVELSNALASAQQLHLTQATKRSTLLLMPYSTSQLATTICHFQATLFNHPLTLPNGRALGNGFVHCCMEFFPKVRTKRYYNALWEALAICMGILCVSH